MSWNRESESLPFLEVYAATLKARGADPSTYGRYSLRSLGHRHSQDRLTARVWEWRCLDLGGNLSHT